MYQLYQDGVFPKLKYVFIIIIAQIEATGEIIGEIVDNIHPGIN